MGTYYLFSNFDMDKGFTAEVAKNLLIDIKDNKTMVFIASDPDYGTGTDKYAGKYVEWFSKIGIIFENYKVIDNRMRKNEMKESIRNASGVFLMGGMTPLQFKFLKANELDEVLSDYQGAVLGLSAGAINMAESSICSKSCGHDKTEIYEGLKLVDISVEPHMQRQPSFLLWRDIPDFKW
ncbi:MAG: hypothetical protein K0R50_3935 [Eubacterium sp.]|nr:hypothetical protein [Eubacterium sp.]